MIPMSKYVDRQVNTVTNRDVYGGSPGASTGTVASGLAPYSAQVGGVSESGVITSDGQTTSASANAAAGAVSTTGLFGRPVTWWLVLVVVVLGGMMLVRKFSSGEGGATFSAIKPSFYNMLAITGNAVVGIVLLKVAFNKVQVPGLTSLINSV